MAADTPRILVADDQTDVLLALRLLLRDAGVNVDSAASVQEVRSRLNAAEYDLLLMDLNYARDTTSGAEGLELLSDVHAHDPLLPVLVMTGWGSIDTAVEAMRRGACGFVHKPWDNAALTAAIRREVEDGRALRRSEQRSARERQEAQAIQRALLPAEMPEAAGADIAARWIPASTFGGDLYDVTPLDDGRAAISIGDVCGKGLPAALLMANVQASVRAFAAIDPSPGSIVSRLNHDLARNAALRRFVTFFLGIYDPGDHTFTYCNAGHLAPILVRADGTTIRLEGGGPVVGAFEDSRFEQHHATMRAADRIVFFTDGISEAHAADDSEFGDAALLETVVRERAAEPRMLVDAVVTAAAAFGGGPFEDDATAMVMAVR